MKRLLCTALLAVAAFSCADDGSLPAGESNEQSQPDEIGNLTLNLTGYDSQGRQYRLRQADFAISSYGYYPYDDYGGRPTPGGYYDGGPGFSTVVSSETDPDADALTVRLVPGQYYVSLQGAWYVERVTATGVERIQQVVLLTPSYQYAYIYHGGISAVVFRFGVDGELIDFRHGDLVIDTEFELPGENPGGYDAGSPYPSYDAGWGGAVDAGVIRL
jgi:hypothetical protein